MKLKQAILLLAIALFLNQPSFGQVYMEWQHCFGGSGVEVAHSVFETNDSGYVICGISTSIDGDVTGNNGDVDFWIVKVDVNGNMQWQKSYGGSAVDAAGSIIQSSDGGYLVLGITNSNDSDVTGNHGNWDIWVIKLDSIGNLMWQRCYGGSNWEESGEIIETPDGYLFISATNSNNGDVTGYQGNGSDMWMVKIDYTGNIIWQKCIYGVNSDRGFSIRRLENGNYLIGGDTYASSFICHSDMDIRNVIVDSVGNFIEEFCRGGSGEDVCLDAIPTLDNGNILVGGVAAGGGNVTGFHYGFPSGDDIWVCKHDSVGNIEWQKCIGGTSYEYARSIVQNADSSYTILGHTESSDGNVTGKIGDTDIWIIKLDDAGNFIYKKCFGGTDPDESNKLIKTHDNKYVVVGSTTSNDINIRGNHGNGDFWVAKFYEEYNSIKGKLFADFNSNQVFDSGDVVIPNKMIVDSTSNNISFSNKNGRYLFAEPNVGNYTVISQPINNFTVTPSSHSASFFGVNQIDSLNDFAYQPTAVVNDLCISLTQLTELSPGFDAGYSITYENTGTTIQNGTIVFTDNNLLSFVSASPAPSQIFGDSLIWNVDSIKPFGTGNILVVFHVDSAAVLGGVLSTQTRIEPLADVNPQCNFVEIADTLVGSFDPNDISVDKSWVLHSTLTNPGFLNYIINFQNTGTDTATTVNVRNNIPDELDITSFEFIAASHPVQILYDNFSRLITFKFANIQLPDSNADEVLSHGFVRYRIKPLTTLNIGDAISNQAAIYFDYNQPVITNYAITNIVTNTSNSETEAINDLHFKIFPNPSNGTFTIQYNLNQNANGFFEVFDFSGKSVFKNEFQKKSTMFYADLNFLSNGVYLCVLNQGGIKSFQKLVILKN